MAQSRSTAQTSPAGQIFQERNPTATGVMRQTCKETRSALLALGAALALSQDRAPDL